MTRSLAPCLAVLATLCVASLSAAEPSAGYAALLRLFAEWRQAQRPPLVAGVPDYTPPALAEQRRKLDALRARLAGVDPAGLLPSERVDRELVEAELNGLDFDLRVLQPWARNPAFYASVIADQSDTPAHEGRPIEGAIELWQLSLPLAPDASRALQERLQAIPRLLVQARVNLTGDARDLWWAGIRSIRAQAGLLGALAERLRPSNPELVGEVERARQATLEFQAWLEAELPRKHGPSGVGRESYDWYLKNVYRVPYTWQDELRLMERELGRARAHLALEEHAHAGLAALEPAANAEEWRRRNQQALELYMRFLREQRIMNVRDYYEQALRERLSPFVPPERRDFFSEVDAREPLLLRCHGNHWLDLARMEHEPQASPVRRGPLLYNIWAHRAEGVATAMEELAMSAGLYAERPRSRELVYVMIAQRAARAISGLRMHSNEWTLDQAVSAACERTPRGWLRRENDLVWSEQQLYLAQPGYGSSYLVGKAEFEELLGERAQALGERFDLARFIDDFDAAGMIPIPLIREELAARAAPRAP
jgi:hypothetical protein